MHFNWSSLQIYLIWREDQIIKLFELKCFDIPRLDLTELRTLGMNLNLWLCFGLLFYLIFKKMLLYIETFGLLLIDRNLWFTLGWSKLMIYSWLIETYDLL